MFTSCSHRVHILFASCSHLVRILCTSCSHRVHILFASCSHLVRILCTSCYSTHFLLTHLFFPFTSIFFSFNSFLLCTGGIVVAAASALRFVDRVFATERIPRKIHSKSSHWIYRSHMASAWFRSCLSKTRHQHQQESDKKIFRRPQHLVHYLHHHSFEERF